MLCGCECDVWICECVDVRVSVTCGCECDVWM